MVDPVVTRRNNRRKGCRRNFLRGGASASYTLGDALVPGLGNSSVINPVSACQAVMRPIPSFSSTAGIPGVGGARRRSRSRRSRKGRKQRGGRYEMTFETTPNGIALGHANPIPCERGGSPTESTSPLYYASRGGAQAISIPTAGYTERPSDFVTATGAPIMLHVPVNARSSCGGARRRRRSHKRSIKRSMKRTRKH